MSTKEQRDMSIRRHGRLHLDDLLEDISVLAPGMWDNDTGPEGWHAVSNLDGIIAYFGSESDALSFRLSYINRILNP